jgi:hypothetical protein
MTNKMRLSNDGAFQINVASIDCTFLENSILKYHMLHLDQILWLLLMVAMYVLTYNDKIEHDVEQVTCTNVTF